MMTIGLLDSNREALTESADWLNSHVLGVQVVIRAASWGRLLTDEHFPPEVVLLRPRPTDRVPVEHEGRVCRVLDAAVIIVTDAAASVTVPEAAGFHLAATIEEAGRVLTDRADHHHSDTGG
jgi:hypothetical protein